MADNEFVDHLTLVLDDTGRIILSDEDLLVLDVVGSVAFAAGGNADCAGSVNSASCINDGNCHSSGNSQTCTNSGNCDYSANRVCQNDVPP